MKTARSKTIKPIVVTSSEWANWEAEVMMFNDVARSVEMPEWNDDYTGFAPTFRDEEEPAQTASEWADYCDDMNALPVDLPTDAELDDMANREDVPF